MIQGQKLNLICRTDSVILISEKAVKMFWNFDNGERAMEALNQIAFCDFTAKKVTLFKPEKFNDFETKFILDLGQKWVDGKLYPKQWSAKQKALIFKLKDKSK